ncbi:hypothetical protein C0Q70_08667 [Pomacea canaliculata]|uniref:BZIP domain-containing protein n=2 Tax=Pomacea canaliculata TaxID=400727 RepID=A0A2T7P7Q0_POMCA|nr:hypothetical protein C0Q70_08667 [Pomacea canaliculata]
MPPFHPFRGTENLGKANSGSTTPRKLDLKNRPRSYCNTRFGPSFTVKDTAAALDIPNQFARRGGHFHHPFCVPMTLSSDQTKSKGTMEYVPSPESFYSPESAPCNDFAAFAASPNSLYMYDQERWDMQNTLNANIFCGQSCGNSEAVSLPDAEFDLEPQYEQSNNLETYFINSPVTNATVVGPLGQATVTHPEKPPSESLLSTEKSEMRGGPTLAQLNMDPLLLEDIVSLISNDDDDLDNQSPETHQQQPQQQQTLNVKTENSTQSLRTDHRGNTFMTLTPVPKSLTATFTSQVPAASATQMYPSQSSIRQNIAVITPVSTSDIKSEPVDPDDKSCLHKLLTQGPTGKLAGALSAQASASPASNRQVMPVVGHKRAPPLKVKSESVEEKWKEIEKFIHNPETSKKRRRTVSGSSESSMDEDLASSGYADYMDDDSSDAESDISDTPLQESLTELAKKSKQYFWQYNVQSKGPKGTRLKLSMTDEDPHKPAKFEDPVFDATNTTLVGIRHGGKARKGDGNEVTPNPKKLFHIGQQLYKLNRQINSFQSTSDLPASVRNKSRKEKNKLASRACRLKKKAQHEANKVKLFGLNCEQNQLLKIGSMIWPSLKERAQLCLQNGIHHKDNHESLTEKLRSLIEAHHKFVIAGNTTDFVNEVIEKVEEGDMTGGLPIADRSRK